MKKLFDFNVKLWKMMVENKVLSMAIVIFIMFSVLNTMLVYSFIHVLEMI